MRGFVSGVVPFLAVLACAADEPKPRVDLYGDPLPPGALARLGTVRFRHAHSYGSLSTAVSPDGKVIATCGDQDIRLWDAKAGRLLRKLDKYHFTRLQFTPDGRHIAAFSYDPPEMRLTEVATGRVALRLPMEATEVWVVAFSRDGKRVVLGQRLQPAAVWDVTTGKRLVELDGDYREFATVVFSHDDKQVFSTTYGGELCQWEPTTGKLRQRALLPVGTLKPARSCPIAP